ncbi:RICIN domain-containing protein [Streptomyces sp. NPDC053069]|uniref:RICIN domain-containing protein n=1 Tax=Streptomyces sp. NPDC053069 TaxID=3365695 RepID=UPI0037D80B2F
MLAAGEAGSCLDDALGASRVWTADCNYFRHDGWRSTNATVVGGYTYWKLRSQDGRCLGVAGASTKSGAALAVGNCTSTKDHSQLWRASSVSGTRYLLVNAHSGKCAGTKGSQTYIGVQVVQGNCYKGPGSTQIWYSRKSR